MLQGTKEKKISAEKGERSEEEDGGSGYRFFYMTNGEELW